VCRRWGPIVFAAPRSLGVRVRLVFSVKTPVKQVLDPWPASPPISIELSWGGPRNEKNLLTALKQKDRIREIHVKKLADTTMERFLAAMEAPFGSAPDLRSVCLIGMPFPSLPRLFSSAADLVYPSVGDIPLSGHLFSPAGGRLRLHIGQASKPSNPFSFLWVTHRETTASAPFTSETYYPPCPQFICLHGQKRGLGLSLHPHRCPPTQIRRHETIRPPILDAPRIAQFIGRTEPGEAFNQDQAHILFYRDLVDITLSSQE
jgi:hypothetical protein